MENPIKQIHKFNHQAGLVEKGYDDFLEASFQVEEALEGFPLYSLCDALGKPHDQFAYPKDMARYLLSKTQGVSGTELSDVDRLDKACDAVVFAVGSMTKLGLTPQQITRALNVVMKANFQKLSMPKDEFGKLTKPSNFVGPEVELQRILDERG